jgi:hypothetical protein
MGDLEIRIQTVVATDDGVQRVDYAWRPELPPRSYLTVLEVLVDNGLPVFRTPFQTHEIAGEDRTQIHTICGRGDPDQDDDEIRTVRF